MKDEEMKKRIDEGINYRDLKLQCRKAEEDKPSYIVEGYATTFNDPYLMYEGSDFRILEQVAPTAFDEADMSDVIVQYDHEGHVYARISNKTLKLSKDDHGLKVEIDLSGTEEGRKLYEEIKGGYTTKMSFGFTIKEETRTEKYVEGGKDEILYTIDKIGKLYDVSAVSLPQNSGTEISARSRFDAEVEKRKAEAEEQAKKAEAEETQKKQADADAANKRARWLFVQQHKNSK